LPEQAALGPRALDAAAAPGYWSGMVNETDTIFAGEAIACVRGARLVFRGLDFDLRAGDALVLVGPNGSGKSSLLRLMACLSRPASGRLRWNQAPIAEDGQAHAARTHYVGHATGAKPALAASEDLAFWSAFRLRDNPDLQRQALARFGLAARADFPVRFLSSGQKRRLALARLIAAPAPLWLLDEPTVGLDTEGQAALEAAIAQHRTGGGIVVVASHTRIELGGGAGALNLSDFSAAHGAFDGEADGYSLELGG
jgi:heme exporter protein A